MIEEVHGKPVEAGDSLGATRIVGLFDDIKEMHTIYDQNKDNTAPSAGTSGWRLLKLLNTQNKSS